MAATKTDIHADRARVLPGRLMNSAPPAAPSGAIWISQPREFLPGSSSRKIVAAMGQLPTHGRLFEAMAPVNAPRSWPNNPLSNNPVGMAAQLSLTNVRAHGFYPDDGSPWQWSSFPGTGFLAQNQHRRVGGRHDPTCPKICFKGWLITMMSSKPCSTYFLFQIQLFSRSIDL